MRRLLRWLSEWGEEQVVREGEVALWLMVMWESKQEDLEGH